MAALQIGENNLEFLSIGSVFENPQQSVASLPGAPTIQRPLQTKQLPAQIQMQPDFKLRPVSR